MSCIFMSCYVMHCVFFCPANSCPEISCPVTWSRNFMSCNFDGPSFSCPSFSVNPKRLPPDSIRYSIGIRIVAADSNSNIWNQRPNLPIHYITFMGLQRRLKRSLYGRTKHPHCKVFSIENFLCRQKQDHKWCFSKIRGVNVKFLFCNPQ